MDVSAGCNSKELIKGPQCSSSTRQSQEEINRADMHAPDRYPTLPKENKIL